MSESYINAQLDREQNCANRSRDVMLKWFAGGALIFGGGTYLAHLYLATIGLAYLRADLALNECRREQVRMDYKEDMKVRSAAWQARKAATEKVHAATEAAQHPQTPHRSTYSTVTPTTETRASASAQGAALHDGSYSREQGHAGAPNKAEK